MLGLPPARHQPARSDDAGAHDRCTGRRPEWRPGKGPRQGRRPRGLRARHLQGQEGCGCGLRGRHRRGTPLTAGPGHRGHEAASRPDRREGHREAPEAVWRALRRARLLRHAGSDPDDPYYTNGSLWGMHGDAVSPHSNRFGSGADEAWAAGAVGSNAVYVGIVDEGVQIDHPDLVTTSGPTRSRSRGTVRTTTAMATSTTSMAGTSSITTPRLRRTRATTMAPTWPAPSAPGEATASEWPAWTGR